MAARLKVGNHEVVADLIRTAVTVASRAPSLHNSQPWRWIATAAALHLQLDRGRIVRNTDAGGREAVIGCGAMLDHVVTTMAAAGWSTTVDRFPDPGDAAHLATLTFAQTDRVADTARRRADAILRRRTDRLPFLAPGNWQIHERNLRDAAEPSAFLDVLPDELRPEIGQAAALTEFAQRYNSGYQAELNWWTASFEYFEGIPRSSLMSAQEFERVAINRSFPAEGNRSRRPGISTDRAKILVLSTPGDGYADALRCGEALSAVLLECTAAGLATCPVSHVTEVPSARAVIGAMLGRPGVPQVLIRVGRVPEMDDVPPLTPRRNVDEILRFATRESS